MDSDTDYPPPSPFLTGLLGRCPRCGKGKAFSGFLALADKCEVCGLDFSFADAGDGPAFFAGSLGGIIVVALALWAELTFSPPVWVHLVIFLPLAVIICLGLLRPFRGILVALQFRNKAEQGRLEDERK